MRRKAGLVLSVLMCVPTAGPVATISLSTAANALSVDSTWPAPMTGARGETRTSSGESSAPGECAHFDNDTSGPGSTSSTTGPSSTEPPTGDPGDSTSITVPTDQANSQLQPQVMDEIRLAQGVEVERLQVYAVSQDGGTLLYGYTFYDHSHELLMLVVRWRDLSTNIEKTVVSTNLSYSAKSWSLSADGRYVGFSVFGRREPTNGLPVRPFSVRARGEGATSAKTIPGDDERSPGVGTTDTTVSTTIPPRESENTWVTAVWDSASNGYVFVTEGSLVSMDRNAESLLLLAYEPFDPGRLWTPDRYVLKNRISGAQVSLTESLGVPVPPGGESLPTKTDAQLSGDGQLVAQAKDGIITLYGATSGEPVCTRRIEGGTGSHTVAGLSRTGRFALVADEVSITWLDMKSGRRETVGDSRDVEGHGCGGAGGAVLGPDGTWVIVTTPSSTGYETPTHGYTKIVIDAEGTRSFPGAALGGFVPNGWWHGFYMCSVAGSDDGETVLFASRLEAAPQWPGLCIQPPDLRPDFCDQWKKSNSVQSSSVRTTNLRWGFLALITRRQKPPPLVPQEPGPVQPPAGARAPTISRKGGLTAARVAAHAKVKIPKGARVTLVVSSKSKRFCTVRKGRLVSLKKGSCRVTVIVTPKKGKPKRATTTLKTS